MNVQIGRCGATKGGQIQGFGPKYEWGEALKHKEMPERDCGHSSWVGYPSGGWIERARMVPPHGGIPDPRETGSQPGLVSPIRRPSPVWGVDVEGRGYRHRWREKRTQGESTQRTAVPTRVRGGKRRSPITHIRRRLAACAWKHGEAGLTRRRRVWVGRHMRSMCVTAGPAWGEKHVFCCQCVIM